jgi:murein DD-endopeptidase MepM/ murein hydrolase activator NlpD
MALRLNGWPVLAAFLIAPSLAAGQSTSQAPSGKPLPLYPKAYSEAYAPPFRSPGRSRVSSGFGWRRHPILGGVRRHEGLDLPKPYGTPVYPAQNGVVTFAGWKNGYGWMVELKHADGGSTVYGHLARYFFVRGQLVNKSMLLGLVGSSGLSTGPHLHFEYRNAAGQAMDPRRFIGLL